MSKSSIALAVFIWTALVTVAAFFYGQHTQANSDTAKYNGETVSRLTDIITNSATLTADAAHASQAMRDIVNTRTSADMLTTKDLQDALAKNAPDRAGCRFDAGLMQQLTAASDRASKAAAAGLRGTVSGDGNTDR